jgi:hypothetical protein
MTIGRLDTFWSCFGDHSILWHVFYFMCSNSFVANKDLRHRDTLNETMSDTAFNPANECLRPLGKGDSGHQRYGLRTALEALSFLGNHSLGAEIVPAFRAQSGQNNLRCVQ